MQEPTQPTTETISLPSGGSIPGIPGEHGPGTYLVDWIKRTISRIEDAAEAAIGHVEEAVHPASPPPADTAPSEPAPEAPAEQPVSEPAPTAPSEPASAPAPVEEASTN